MQKRINERIDYIATELAAQYLNSASNESVEIVRALLLQGSIITLEVAREVEVEEINQIHREIYEGRERKQV